MRVQVRRALTHAACRDLVFHVYFNGCFGGASAHEEVPIMGCFHALLARAALLGTWIWTPLVGRAFGGGVGGWLLPLLGLLFLPVTTLAYVVVNALGGGVTGWAWLWIVLAFLF